MPDYDEAKEDTPFLSSAAWDGRGNELLGEQCSMSTLIATCDGQLWSHVTLSHTLAGVFLLGFSVVHPLRRQRNWLVLEAVSSATKSSDGQ